MGFVEYYTNAMIKPETLIVQKETGIDKLKIEFFYSSFAFWGGGMVLGSIILIIEMINGKTNCSLMFFELSV